MTELDERLEEIDLNLRFSRDLSRVERATFVLRGLPTKTQVGDGPVKHGFQEDLVHVGPDMTTFELLRSFQRDMRLLLDEVLRLKKKVGEER